LICNRNLCFGLKNYVGYYYYLGQDPEVGDEERRRKEAETALAQHNVDQNDGQDNVF